MRSRIVKKKSLNKEITDLRLFAKERGITMPRQKDILNEAATKILRKYKIIDKRTQAKDILDDLK